VKLIEFFYINICCFVENYQIWLHCFILWRRYDQNNLIQYGRGRHVEFTSGLHFDIFSRLGRQNVSAYQISCKLVNILRSYDVSHIFKMASVRHLEFWKIKILDKFSRGSQNLLRHTKFGQNRMIGGQDIAIKPKSNMAAVAMLNLLPFYILTYFEDNGGKMCLYTKFHTIRTIFGEVITFHRVSRWRPPRSRDITICNSGPRTKSPRWSELAVQIWFRNLDYFWIYHNFSILSLCM